MCLWYMYAPFSAIIYWPTLSWEHWNWQLSVLFKTNCHLCHILNWQLCWQSIWQWPSHLFLLCVVHVVFQLFFNKALDITVGTVLLAISLTRVNRSPAFAVTTLATIPPYFGLILKTEIIPSCFGLILDKTNNFSSSWFFNLFSLPSRLNFSTSLSHFL